MIAVALHRADGEIDVPLAVAFPAAVAAAEAFDVGAYRSDHEFPECFVCGPDRAEGDGLRVFSAPCDRPGLHVWPWIPTASLFDDGEIDAALVWAALDCPGGLAVLADDTLGPAVLGKLVGKVVRRPERGERLVVAGWAGDRDGRKVQAGSAVWSESGEVLAAGRATWIELTAEQRRAFGGAGSERLSERRQFRGTWLQGTSRSTRTSPGRPRTRSPRMLYITSDVPPSIELARLRRNAFCTLSVSDENARALHRVVAVERPCRAEQRDG